MEKFFVDAQGRFLGSFVGARRVVQVQTGERAVTGLAPVTAKVRRLVPALAHAANGTPSVTLEEREIEEPVVDDVPVRDAAGQPIFVDDSGNPTTKSLGKPLVIRTPRLAPAVIGKEPIYEMREEAVAAEVPPGAVEVPSAPPGPAYLWLWRAGAWSRNPAAAESPGAPKDELAEIKARLAALEARPLRA